MGLFSFSKSKPRNRMAAGGAVVAIALAVVGTHEGLRTSTYRDSVGVPTVCYGETRGIRMGMKFSKPECDAMLLNGLIEFADGMEKCVSARMTDSQYVAFLSLSYNIGTGAFCKSTAVREFNAGHTRAGCEAILKFDKAGGRVLPGLTRRRREERDLCLKDL